jgi:hypothetical protein
MREDTFRKKKASRCAIKRKDVMQRRTGPIFIIALLIFFFWSGLSSAQVLKIPFVAISPATGPLWIGQDACKFSAPGFDKAQKYMP